jgi:hypothetical protein
MRAISLSTIVCFSLLASIPQAFAQKTGQSARITVGVVTHVQKVDLASNKNRNSLLGGAAGWALARNQSSGKQAAAALGGAALGRGATNRSEGANTGMQYTVQTSAGSAIQIITDQTEVRIGDCVTVEETQNGANVRRSDPSMCQAPPEVMAAVEDELQEEANECDQAKQRLINAETSEQVDVARQVVEILCND